MAKSKSKKPARKPATGTVSKAAARTELRFRSRGPDGARLSPRPAKPKGTRNADARRMSKAQLVKRAK